MNRPGNENAPLKKTIRRFPTGIVIPPPSKSIMHRALICEALAGVPAAASRIINPAESDDIRATAHALAAILAAPPPLPGAIECGESGSTLRFLLPVAAMQGRVMHFTGRGRLMSRPLSVYEETFRAHGAHLTRTPYGIEVLGPLQPGVYRIPGDVSSQFITGLMLALPVCKADSEIILTTPLESESYVRLTMDVLSHYGITIRETVPGERYTIPGGQKYVAKDYRIESDWSQAAFFLCAAALGQTLEVREMNWDSVQGDKQIMRALSSMHITVAPGPPRDMDGPTAVLHSGGAFGIGRRGRPPGIPLPGGHIFAPRFLRRKQVPEADMTRVVLYVYPPDEGFSGADIDVRDIPDLVPPLAALACFAHGQTRFLNAGRLRLKESDRLAALVSELGAIGADIHAEGDTLIVNGSGGAVLPGGETDAHGDHRIAMALAVAAIGCDGPVTLTGWESVSKSYPGFWEDFEKSDVAEWRQEDE
jgi:3-phosphoshikimate 1-carboxyvinyltransferase